MKTLNLAVKKLRNGIFKVALMDGEKPVLAKTIQAPNERLFKKRVNRAARRLVHQARIRFNEVVGVR